MKSWTTKDYFDRAGGSSVWPTTDTDASPCDTFTCKMCGYTFKERIYGLVSIFDASGEEKAEDKMLKHIRDFHIMSSQNKDETEG